MQYSSTFVASIDSAAYTPDGFPAKRRKLLSNSELISDNGAVPAINLTPSKTELVAKSKMEELFTPSPPAKIPLYPEVLSWV